MKTLARQHEKAEILRRLRTLRPWPGGYPTRPEIDQEVGGTTPGDFAADVMKLEALLALITAETGGVEWGTHPIFGRMSTAAWLRWAYLHTDHHLRQFGA